MLSRHGAWIAVLACALTACRSWDAGRAPSAARRSEPALVSSDLRDLSGRPFLLTVLAAPDPSLPAGSSDSGLCIQGDDRRFSFGSTTGPATLVIVGSKIQFGGHSFEVTDKPGVYVVDGVRHTLGAWPRCLHVFWEGRLIESTSE